MNWFKLVIIIVIFSRSIIAQEYISTTSMEINNLKVGLGNNGIIGNVFGTSEFSATIEGVSFLYASGLFLSGYSDGKMWSTGIYPSGRLEAFSPGNVGFNLDDKSFKIFELRSNESDFSESWYDWKTAVDQGAYFYDGDNNGVYEVIDKNGNGVWDPDEDKPDLLGDYTAWCVYNDTTDRNNRKFDDYIKQGIEIRQTVFATGLHNDNTLANTFFVRYVIENSGTVSDMFDSVYFGIAADPDIGENYDNDLIGADSLEQAGYAFSSVPDSSFDENSLCLYIDQLQGPHAHIPGETFIDANNNGYYNKGIDVVLDTAEVFRGPLLGIKEIPGAKTIQLNAISHLTRYYYISDPDNQTQLRYNLMGDVYNHDGSPISACDWPYGNGNELENCSEINPKYMYSGNPIDGTGWLDQQPLDTRLLLSSGPFYLQKNNPVEIIAAFIVGRGTDAINSITVAREIDDYVQQVYDNNFEDLPVGIVAEEAIPKLYSMAQNYPNPFNPSTTIQYSIPVVEALSFTLSGAEAGVEGLNQNSTELNVTLKVYDILGREVATLVNEQQRPGNYEVQFDASNITSGVYFYIIQSGKYRDTKKMVLLR